MTAGGKHLHDLRIVALDRIECCGCGGCEQCGCKCPPTVTSVLGETRDVGQVWSGGAYACPFCTHPVTGDACDNPACSANPSTTVATALERRAEVEARQREADERDRIMAIQTAYAERAYAGGAA